MLETVYKIISMFVLMHPILSIYLMGSMIATGICYSLLSTGMIKLKDQGLSSKNMSYLHAFLSSWLLVIIFLFGILKGFFGVIFGKNNNGGY